MKKLYILLFGLLFIKSSLSAYDVAYCTKKAGNTWHYTRFDHYYAVTDTSIYPDPGSNTFRENMYFRELFCRINNVAYYTRISYANNVHCTLPKVLDKSTGKCTIPCNPIAGSDILDLNQSMCIGNTTIFSGGMGTNYTELTYQTCDSTCYGIPTSYKTCDQLIPTYEKQCTSNENLIFHCTETNGIGVVDENTTSCQAKVNPCDTAYNKILNTCNLDTHTMDGFAECTHNGMMVTNDTIKCVPKVNGVAPANPDNCYNTFNEVFNSTTQQCDCKSGYVRDSFGDCSLPLDVNATAKDKAIKNQQNATLAKEKAKAVLDRNTSKNQYIANQTQSDTLTALRNDLNSTNSLLNDMSSKLSNDTASNGILGKLSNIYDALTGASANGHSLDYAKNNLGSAMTSYSFNFTTGTCGNVQTLSYNYYGHDMIFFSQDLLNKLPIATIKTAIIFIFTISGLIVVFRSV